MKKTKTLTDKWFELKREVEQLNQKRIDDFFQNRKKPSGFFELQWRGTEIEEWEIVGFGVVYNELPKEPSLVGNLKITRKHLKDYQEYLKSIKDKKCKYDILIYKKKGDMSGIEFFDHIGVSSCSFSRSDLEGTALENKEKYAPRDGFKPCYYCGVQKPGKELICRTITSRNTRLTCKQFFCSAECAAKMQMASEG